MNSNQLYDRYKSESIVAVPSFKCICSTNNDKEDQKISQDCLDSVINLLVLIQMLKFYLNFQAALGGRNAKFES